MNETEGARVICDACGKETAINLWTREIAKERDGYFPVVEKYFCCEACGKHYTVGVYDHEQSMNVQKRRRLQRMIRLHISIRSRQETIEGLQKEEQRLKAKMLKRAERLKEKYREECANA